MMPTWQRPLWQRVGFIVVALLSPAGCQAWHTEGLAPQRVLAEQAPARLRVIRNDRTAVIVEAPALHADTILGLVGQTPVRIPLSDIRETATRRVSLGRTIALIASIPFGLIALIAAAGGIN